MINIRKTKSISDHLKFCSFLKLIFCFSKFTFLSKILRFGKVKLVSHECDFSNTKILDKKSEFRISLINFINKRNFKLQKLRYIYIWDSFANIYIFYFYCGLFDFQDYLYDCLVSKYLFLFCFLSN